MENNTITVDGKMFKCLSCRNVTFNIDEVSGNCTCTECNRVHTSLLNRIFYKYGIYIQ